MAIEIRTIRENIVTGNASNQVSVTKPLTVLDNDYIVVIMGVGDDLPNMAPPADWTTGNLLASAAGNDEQIGIFYKKITNAAGEPASYTFTVGSGDTAIYWCASMSGIDLTTPEDETMAGNAVALANDLSPAAPSITVATAGAFVFAGWATNFWTNATAPGGAWTTRRLNYQGGTCSFSLVSKVMAAPGATGDVEIVSTTTGQETVCGQWAFRPSATTPVSITLDTALVTTTGRASAVQKGAITKTLDVALLTTTGNSSSIFILQSLYPSADTSLGSWTDQSGGTTNIYTTIDEASVNDSDYVQSPILPNTNTYKFKLDIGEDAGIHTGHVVYVRHKRSLAGTSTLAIRLLEGNTIIASWSKSVTETWTTITETLTELQAAAITDYSNLYIELEAS